MGGTHFPPIIRCKGLSMKVVDPPHGFHIADCSQIALGGGKIRIPEDQLTHDVYRSAGAGSIGGCMPSQIMGG